MVHQVGLYYVDISRYRVNKTQNLLWNLRGAVYTEEQIISFVIFSSVKVKEA
jgi:hypothetical protein